MARRALRRIDSAANTPGRPGEVYSLNAEVSRGCFGVTRTTTDTAETRNCHALHTAGKTTRIHD